MGLPVPFRFITGLPHQAQVEIERDFLDVIMQIHDSPTIFDAVIDPTLSASDPSTHQYVNLTELIDGESWAPSVMFNVGVKQDALTPIVEPTSPLSLIGLGDISLFGIDNFLTDVTHIGWDWAALTIGASQQVFLYNITLAATDVGG